MKPLPSPTVSMLPLKVKRIESNHARSASPPKSRSGEKSSKTKRRAKGKKRRRETKQVSYLLKFYSYSFSLLIY